MDISKVGLKQFWNLKGHMQDASQLATAHYPETLDRIFIIGAPAFFPTVWGWIKRWFDPITVSKIFILSQADMFPTLSQYIDPENIPKKYGGNLDFEFGMMPILEPAIEKALTWENPEKQNGKNIWPIGPIKWEESSDGTVKAVAVGSEGGKPRRRVIAKLTTEISIKAMHGSLVTGNTPVDEAELALTTVGTATHPPNTDEADLYVGADPAERETSTEEPKPGVLEQAKETVVSTVESATGAVENLVLSEKTKPADEKAPAAENTKTEEEKKLDGAIDSEKPVVEGYLREQYSSKT